MNKRTMKKGLAIVLALVMVFAMTATALAADSDPNLTFVNDAQARTEYQLSDITSTTKLQLQATPASTRWSATTFDTKSAAQEVSWSSTNSDMAVIDSVDAVAASTGGYYSQATISIKSSAGAGACSIKAAKGSAYVNFTIVIEDTAQATTNTASNVSVYINDARGDTLLNVAKTGVTASLPTESTNPFYSASYKADTYSTPAYALSAIKNPNGQYNVDEYAADYVTNFTIFASNTPTIPTTYINTITTDVLNGDTNVVENKTYAPISSEAGYYGWYYRVVRDGSVVEESKVIGAADFKLNTNDTVYWLFGTETEVDNFMSAF